MSARRNDCHFRMCVLTSCFCVRHSTQFQERLERIFRLWCFADQLTFHLLMLLVCLHFIVKQQQKLSSLFTQKTIEVGPEKHEDGLDKDGSETWEVSSISQPPELQEPIGDSWDDFSCSKFQIETPMISYHTCSLTETIFEMTQFKMPCGPLSSSIKYKCFLTKFFSHSIIYRPWTTIKELSVHACISCGSKNYPYSPHGRDFSLEPHHLQEIPVKLHTFT